MTLDEAREHIGQPVVFRREGHASKRGMIISIGERSVFVQYNESLYASPSSPADLTLATDTASFL